jgi:hypothetical protein
VGFAYGETVTFLGPGSTEDDYGNTVEDWGNPVAVLTKPNAGVEPRPVGSENYENRNAVTDGFTLYWLGDVFDVDPRWKAQVRGETWDILGPEAGWVSPFTGWNAGTVVQVGRTSG